MNNNGKLKSICNAVHLEALDIVEIFELADVTIDEALVKKIFLPDAETISYDMLGSFLNGLIIFNRGEKEDQDKRPPMAIEDPRSVNNVILKKMKIAFSFDSKEMLELLNEGEVKISKEKLSSLFRKEGHRSYKYCREVYIEEFLKALKKKTLF